MTQKERDGLVALKKAKKKLITQKEAAAEIGVSERQVRRMLRSLKERGDKAVIHAARGRKSNRKITDQVREKAIKVLSQEVYLGFGPTLAAEYLAKKHAVEVSRETLRGWMATAKLWRAKAKRVKKVHTWRTRRSRWGELVQMGCEASPLQGHGYQRARLAGGPRSEAVSDQHDRRRDQPDVGTLRGARLDRREHASARELPGCVFRRCEWSIPTM